MSWSVQKKKKSNVLRKPNISYILVHTVQEKKNINLESWVEKAELGCNVTAKSASLSLSLMHIIWVLGLGYITLIVYYE